MKNIYCAIFFYTKTKVKLLSADEKVATVKSSPGITIVPKNYEVTIEFSFFLSTRLKVSYFQNVLLVLLFGQKTNVIISGFLP